MEGIISCIRGVLERPDAERPYLELAKAYGKAGMKEEAAALFFLAGRRFGSKDDAHPDPDEGQREDD